MTERYETSETDPSVKEDRLIYTGLLAFAVAALIACVSLTSVDIPLTVALYAFAISIPFLAFSIYGITMELGYKYTIFPWYVTLANILGPLGSLLGIISIFWHFSWIMAIIFAAFSILAGIFLGLYSDALKKANAEDSAQKDAAADR